MDRIPAKAFAGDARLARLRWLDRQRRRAHVRLPTMSSKLIVAGGGIGGLAAAFALRRAGLEAAVYERAPAFAEVGAGLSLWPNATRILKAWGLLEAVLELGEPVAGFDLRRPDGNLIAAVSLAGFGVPALCLHRADLHRVLLRALPDSCLAPSHRLEGFRQDSEGVWARFATGLEVRADGLVAADGINSAVRSQLHGRGAPNYRGYCIWRGIAPANPGCARGRNSETWGRGRRFGIMPIGQGRICWYATRNGPPEQAGAPEAWKAELQERFQDWHAPIPALIAATPPEELIKVDACDRDPLRRWGDGRITLLGDAAHPITPNLGQGAGLAIEDAACLAKCVPAAGGLAAAFRAYEARRRCRTARVARQARCLGAIGQWAHPWLLPARELAARIVLRREPGALLQVLYSYEV
jgi:2-polyprenyl-6-methoxyphenol hydroxylase-like FAD-dependent oxidoreductase